MGLTSSWGATDENFQGEQASEEIEFIVQEFHGLASDTLFAMPLSVEIQELRGDAEFQIKRKHLTPFFVDNVCESDLLSGATTETGRYYLDDLTLG